MLPAILHLDKEPPNIIWRLDRFQVKFVLHGEAKENLALAGINLLPMTQFY
jgi:hypothetical protein